MNIPIRSPLARIFIALLLKPDWNKHYKIQLFGSGVFFPKMRYMLKERVDLMRTSAMVVSGFEFKV